MSDHPQNEQLSGGVYPAAGSRVVDSVVRGTSLSVIGGGFVGLVSAAGFAEFGHSVVCVEKDPAKLASLKLGKVPFFEKDLDDLIRRNVEAGTLSFTDDLDSAVEGATAVFIAVGTPSGPDGRTDQTALDEVILKLAERLGENQIVVLKSTVPVGTGKRVRDLLMEKDDGSGCATVVNNPEFLREGSAVYDFFNPQRIVIGSSCSRASETITHLYRLGMVKPVPVLVTNNETAEMIKYACNAFLATKVGFINELAGLCDLADVNVLEVARGMGMDSRIGPEFLDPGPGWGGSCFGKDMREIIGLARASGYHWHIGQSVLEANSKQHDLVVEKIDGLVGGLKDKKICALGLAFKAGTSDMRDSPAIEIIKKLISSGSIVKAFDPQANGEARQLVPKLKIADSIYEAAMGADCVVILTEWQEFQLIDFSRLADGMNRANIVDARNLLAPETARKYGFNYRGIGQK